MCTLYSGEELTTIDRMLAKAWASNFPDRVDEKIRPHSLRKCMVRALYDMLKITGKFSDRDVDEFVNWFNKSKATRAAYATLSRDEMCDMLASLDPEVLPWDIATVSKPPALY